MLKLTQALMEEKEFAKLVYGLEQGKSPAVLSGLEGIHRAHAAAALRKEMNRPLVLICSDEMEAKKLAADVEVMTQETPRLLFARDYTFYNSEGVSRQMEQQRINTLFAMSQDKAPIVVATVDGVLQRTIPKEMLEKTSCLLQMDGEYDLDQLAQTLINGGYSHCDQVEGPGQFALRGGILDFFSPAYQEPVRCEFFGDQVDSMSMFDVLTQRRTDAIDRAVIVPAAETLPTMYSSESGEGVSGLVSELKKLYAELEKKKNTNPDLFTNIDGDIQRLEGGRGLPAADRYMELIYPMATALNYVAHDAIIVISEPNRTGERAKNYIWQLNEDTKALLEGGILDSRLVRFCQTWEDACAILEDYPVVMCDSFTTSNYPMTVKGLYSLTAKQLPSYGGSMETAVSDISHYISTGYRTVILCQDERRAGILKGLLQEKGIEAALDTVLQKLPEEGKCVLTLGACSAGIEYPSIKLAVITEGQISDVKMYRRKKKKLPSNRQRLESYTDLSPGDLVVHEYHGIGRYVGIFKMRVDGVDKDYIKITYAGTDSLYVPATQLDLISKYIGGGGEDAPVRLSKMGGTEWAKTKSRAKAAAKDLAKGLIALYAERTKRKGHAFAKDSVWQTEFEEKFGYRETDDQLRSIEEIKTDMEKEMPMDRLLCGDVGYGKTEVALRAVMKCVLDGMQAAILVPTTVLAQQHYVTAVRRFSGYPVKIEVMSRFRTGAQLKEVIRGLKDGSVDLVIGTHKLLQKDIKFKQLGLLIVDEEQRFGVTHKERLKEMSKQVDVLTLSATPIPRTLNMALTGLRDMSTIEEPPQDRQPVQTYVLEHDWGIIGDAIRREVSRGGQVYYIHNRVKTIERVAGRISGMIGEINVGVAHGKMDEETLSEVMERMSTGQLQVLVCTTIIETGIDIPNVNTLIIEDADKLGLAQLHQIRGRVGRSSRRAYAYLTFRHGKILSEIAEKRLSAIREFAEFNSGFKIAMRDLEIRGAGNLLGAEQSGHMTTVGYDMYLRLLEEAVLEEKGEKPEKKADCAADLAVTANIPEWYVASSEQRMDLYRRIAHIRTEDDSDEMIGELIDRFGDPPAEVTALVAIGLLRGEATEAGIIEISQKSGWIRFKLADFDMEQVSTLYSMKAYKGKMKIEAGTEPIIALKPSSKRIVEEALSFVRAYKSKKVNL